MWTIFNNEPARQDVEIFYILKTSEDGDATVLGIISCDGVITATSEIMERNLAEKGYYATKLSVVQNGDLFVGGDEAVDYIEAVQGGHTDLTAERTLYWKRGLTKMDIGPLYKLTRPLVASSYWKNVNRHAEFFE